MLDHLQNEAFQLLAHQGAGRTQKVVKSAIIDFLSCTFWLICNYGKLYLHL
jgi:hypothetical protein